MISPVLSSTAVSAIARTRPIDPNSQGKGQLTAEEKAELQRLKQRDAEVRKHEQAHAAAGGSHAGAPSFEYERGPDGKMYAVGGHVSIDVSAVEGDPKRTLAKMEQVQRAANAPADPSAQDKRVAASAATKAAEARRDLAKEESAGEGAAEVGRRRGMQAYARAMSGEAPASSMSIVACGTCGSGHEGGH